MQGMQEGLQGIQSDLITPEHVAEELKAMGLVTGSLFVVHRLLDLTPLKVSVVEQFSMFLCKDPLSRVWMVNGHAMSDPLPSTKSWDLC